MAERHKADQSEIGAAIECEANQVDCQEAQPLDMGGVLRGAAERPNAVEQPIAGCRHRIGDAARPIQANQSAQSVNDSGVNRQAQHAHHAEADELDQKGAMFRAKGDHSVGVAWRANSAK